MCHRVWYRCHQSHKGTDLFLISSTRNLSSNSLATTLSLGLIFLSGRLPPLSLFNTRTLVSSLICREEPFLPDRTCNQSSPLERERHPKNLYLWLYQGILVSYRVLNQSRDRKKHILCILNLSLLTIGLLLDRFTFFLQLAYYSGKLGW